MTVVDRVRVGDVLKLERTSIEPDPSIEYVAIGVRSFGKGIFHYEPKSGNQLGSLRFFSVQPDRLVISNIKGWEGAIAVSEADDSGCLASNRFLTYIPADDRIDVRWARWYFLSERGIELIQRASPGSADRNRTLAIERFENLVIPLPTVDDQRLAAARLDQLSSWSGQVMSAFVDSGRETIISALPAFVEAIVRSGAESTTTVGELVEFVSDTVHPGDDPLPAECFVGLQHVESHTGRCLGSDSIGAMKGRKFRFRPGDVLFGYLRPYLNKVWVADRHGLCSVDQYVLRPHPHVSADILGHTLRGRSVLAAAVEMTHSLQLPRLRSGLLAGIEIPTVSETQTPRVLHQLDVARELLTAAAQRRNHQLQVARAIVPAALNEEFGALG